MRLFTLLLSCWLFQSASLLAQLAPPFGREWGEDPSGLLNWAGKHSLDVTVDLPGDSPDLQFFRFQQPGGGLPGHPAESIEARFYRNELYELTVFYEYPSKTPDEVRKVFHGMKDHFVKKWGEFKLNGRATNASDGYLVREESYHYEPAAGVFLLMAYSSMEDTLRKKGEARFSVIYHNGAQGPPAMGVLPQMEEEQGNE